MQNTDAKSLFKKYQDGTATPEEKAIVENWLTFGEATELDLSTDELEQDLADLKNRIVKIPVMTIRLWPRILAAASVMLILSFGLYFYKNRTSLIQQQKDTYANDVAPGGNKATLKLSNGRIIPLSDMKTGIVINAVELVYNDGTKLGESTGTPHSNEKVSVSTPLGGQYHVTLPDGTKVWLNAGSTLTFQASFIKDRKVELTGEGYFEVTKDKLHPFSVSSGKQEVEVLGTHFNINSYPSEGAIRTTLMEGSVKVKYAERDYLLQVGQQAVVGKGVEIVNVDTDEVGDWKNGIFNFQDKDIKTVMRVLERWYDIDVKYEGEVTQIGFNAEISRNKTLIQVLKILEKTGGVKFKVEGRRVTVM